MYISTFMNHVSLFRKDTEYSSTSENRVQSQNLPSSTTTYQQQQHLDDTNNVITSKETYPSSSTTNTYHPDIVTTAAYRDDDRRFAIDDYSTEANYSVSQDMNGYVPRDRSEYSTSHRQGTEIRIRIIVL